MKNSFCHINFSKKSSPGVSLLLAYSWLSMALDLAQMVLEVGKNLKPTLLYMINISCFNKFA